MRAAPKFWRYDVWDYEGESLEGVYDSLEEATAATLRSTVDRGRVLEVADNRPVREWTIGGGGIWVGPTDA